MSKILPIILSVLMIKLSRSDKSDHPKSKDNKQKKIAQRNMNSLYFI